MKMLECISGSFMPLLKKNSVDSQKSIQILILYQQASLTLTSKFSIKGQKEISYFEKKTLYIDV